MENYLNIAAKLKHHTFRWLLMRALLHIPYTPLKYRINYGLKFTGPDNSKLRPRYRGKIRWCSSNDIPMIVESMNRPDKEDIFKYRLNNGDKCIVASNDQREVAGYGWLTLGNKHIEDKTGCVFTFPESSMYAYDIFIKAEYRMHGVWVGLMQSILQSEYFKQEVGLHCLIDYGNTKSFKTHFRYSFEIYQKTTIITILRKQYIFSKTFEHTEQNINEVLIEK